MGLAAPAVAGEIHWRGARATTTFTDAQTVARQLADAATSARADEPTRLIVQFDRPIQPAEREQLQQAGVTLLGYLGDHAYFAAVSATSLDANSIARVNALRAMLPIEPSWKLHPSLLGGEIVPWAIVNDAHDAAGEPDADDESAADEVRPDEADADDADPTVACYVLFHADVDLATQALPLVIRHGARVQSWLRSINGLVIELPWSQIDALAAASAVQYIEPPLPQFSEMNNSNRARTGADVAQVVPYNLDGSGVSVMVYDGGSVLTTHADFGGRATVRDGSGLGDHPTHVAGTIGGDGSASGGVYRGMAPGVTIESYSFETEGPLQAGFLYTDPGDIEQDYGDAINNYGADIANNSIGTNTAHNNFPCEWTGDYNTTSALIDAVVRGSLGTPFRVVWANGNERGTTRCGDLYATTAPPAGAKNHLTVGALNSNDDSVTSFTSWGPVDDGRLKPDVSAPGCQSDDDAGVTSTSSSGGYNTKCGTSMACPTVTGLAALLLQDYRVYYPAAPDFRNSTLRAVFAHTAEDIENPGPDYMTGYGSVRIIPAIEQMRSGNFYESTVAQGEVHQSLVIVQPGDTELRVTLAWDDYPALPMVSPVLVNDLDVRVIDAGMFVHYPWTLDPNNPAAPAVQVQPDRRNNIEQVLIEAPTPGAYIVEIVGYNVPHGPQPFSLVASPWLVDCTPAGTLTFDRVSYQCESVLTLSLNDCHLNTDNAVVETVSLPITSTSEPSGETILLTETGPETARFVGSVVLSTTDDIGVLHVAAGDSVTATYIDADDGLGGTDVEVVTSVDVDCSPPVVSGVAAVDLGPRSARIILDTDEPAEVLVRYGLTCDALTEEAQVAGFRVTHSINLTGLTDNTPYYFELVVEDEAGNVLINDDGGACYTFTTPDIPNYFTEQFYGTFDLAHRVITFVPDGSVDFYDVCSYATLVLPTDPSVGLPLSLGDTDTATVALAGGAQVLLYGTAYNVLYINANGNITFNHADGDTSESYLDHFDSPRVSLLFDDLNPALRGQVRWQQFADRVVVTWDDVTEDEEYNGNTFQVELYFDGRIQMAWGAIAAHDGLVGLSQGADIPIDFLPSDLSELDSCGPRPPSAGDMTAVAGEDRAATIALPALDDGWPEPPGALTYTILSLPAHTLRDAADDHLIELADLPYTLVGGGNQVVYASSGFVGQDSFTFLASDGGTPPDGGDSNAGTITVDVNPVLNIPFFDDFPTTTFDTGKWLNVFYATIDDAGLGIPSPPYALRLNGSPIGIDELTTHLIDLSAVSAVRLSYAWQRTGGGESPDAGDNLRVEFRTSSGQWVVLEEYAGDGEDMTLFEIETLLLPPEALHASFQLRFHVTGSSASAPYDDWFIDDVSLMVADAPFAYSQAVTVEVDGARDIVLDATDPNGDPLDFIIVSLPDHGALSDPGAGPIDAGDLPYTLVAGGYVVHYEPTPGYMGPDLFGFEATDGTYFSNTATITLAVEPILTLPFFDEFPTAVFESTRWAVTSGATIDNVGLDEPSPPLAARLNAQPAGGDVLQSFAVNLEGIAPVRVEYDWQRTGGGDSPENGDDLFVEYRDCDGIWRILNRHEGAGDDMTTFELANVLLPAGALHREFRLRFRSTSSGTTGDDWFIDDVHMYIPVVPEAFDRDVQLAKHGAAMLELEAIDPNGDPLDYIIVSLPTVGELIDAATATLIAPAVLPYTLASGGNSVAYFPPLGYTGEVGLEFYAHDGVHDSNVATVTITVAAPQFTYNYPLNTDPGWSTEGQWEFGIPLGQYGDPIHGYTGTYVYGYNLAGRYGHNIPPYYLTTTAIDCSRLVEAELRFRRWLGVEESWFDHATIEVSADGSAWTLLWENPTTPLNEQVWSYQAYALGSTADRQPTVFIRWGMGPTDGGVAYHGWNIDDIEIVGSLQPTGGDVDSDGQVGATDQRGFEACFFGPDMLPAPPSPMTPADCLDAFDFDGDDDVDCEDWDAFVEIWTGPPATPESLTACALIGDLNCDGVVNYGDIDPFVLALTGQAAYEAWYPNCRWLNADCNNDGTVDYADIDAFVAVLSGGGK